MSYHNLAIYDFGLLNNNTEFKITLWGNAKYKYKSIKGVTFIPIFKYSDKKGIFKLLSYGYSLLRIFFSILIQKPSLIHIQWIRLPIVDILFISVVKLIYPKTRIVYTVHNILPHNYSLKDKKQYLQYYQKIDAIITHSFNSKKELLNITKLNETKINVIFHGLLNFEIDKEVTENRIKKLHDDYAFRNKIVFSSLGIQSYYKGTDIIVKYFSENMSEDVFLIIAGKNDNIDLDLLRGKENILIIERFVSDEEFLALMKITDVLLLPYREISQSGVLLTAINEQVPVLVSDAGGLAEPLFYGEIGWSFKQNKFDEFFRILDELIRFPKEINRIKVNNSEWGKVQKVYHWDNIQNNSFELYNKLIGVY